MLLSYIFTEFEITKSSNKLLTKSTVFNEEIEKTHLDLKVAIERDSDNIKSQLLTKTIY